MKLRRALVHLLSSTVKNIAWGARAGPRTPLFDTALRAVGWKFLNIWFNGGGRAKVLSRLTVVSRVNVCHKVLTQCEVVHRACNGFLTGGYHAGPQSLRNNTTIQ